MQIVVVAHNIRSTHNVGSIFRTCDGFGAEQLYLTGYTPYPAIPNDERPPHVRTKLTDQIHKTALDAEQTVPFMHADDPVPILLQYKARGYTIAALEQTATSILLPEYQPLSDQMVLVLGEEVRGIPNNILSHCSVILEIPMTGKKESFNVSVATGVVLYALTTKI